MNWQPLSTAPKDGTFVILYDGLEYQCVLGRWSGRKWVDHHGRAVWAGESDCEPTHWTPSPQDIEPHEWDEDEKDATVDTWQEPQEPI